MDCILRKTDIIGVHQDIAIQCANVKTHERLHTHDFIELAYVAHGAGIHHIENEFLSIKSKDIILMNGGVYHEYFNETDQPLTIYNCLFVPKIIDGSLASCCNSFISVIYTFLFNTLTDENNCHNYICLTDHFPYNLGDIVIEMYQEYTEGKPGSTQMICADLVRLLVSFFRLYKSSCRIQFGCASFKQITVTHAITYMKKNYSQHLTAKAMATMYYVSPGYFRRIFTETTGVSFAQALRTVRMEAAFELVQSTALPIEEIIPRVGYNDLKTFYTNFKNHFGTTPGAVRRQK